MANAKGGALDKLNEDLQDVTRIMTKNMEDLLWRGDSLDRERCSLLSDVTN
jgi:vesicle transport protein SEC22